MEIKMAANVEGGFDILPDLNVEIEPEFEDEMETDAIPDAPDSIVDDDIEDGEVSDSKDSPRLRRSNAKSDVVPLQVGGTGDNIELFEPLLTQDKRYVNKADVLGHEEKAKLTERAKRFGLDPANLQPLTEQELSKLYASLDVRADEDKSRLHSLHMRGTEDMSTEDIFTYFKSYGPDSIEWINDFSCNVVWMDKLSAAQALIGLSRNVKGLDKLTTQVNADDTPMTEEDSDHSSDAAVDAGLISIPVPPGKWRLGVEHPKAKNILLRFSNRSDKKPRQAEKNSDYYKRHGNPNYGGIKGLLTESRKRRFRRDESKASDPWGDLATSWNKPDSDPQEPEVRERRTSMPEPREPETREQSRSRLPRMRMYADDEEAKIEKRKAHQADLRSRLQRERRNSPESENDSDDAPIQRKRFAGDLRSKLNSKQQQLCIELDTEQYYDLIASESDH